MVKIIVSHKRNKKGKCPGYTEEFKREAVNQVVVPDGHDEPVCPKHCRLVDEQPNER